MQLTILPLEETIDAEPGETMLEACLRHGIWLPYACSHGRCGTCKVVRGPIHPLGTCKVFLRKMEGGAPT